MVLQSVEEQSGAGALLQPKRSVKKRQSEQRHGQESRNQKKAHSKVSSIKLAFTGQICVYMLSAFEAISPIA